MVEPRQAGPALTGGIPGPADVETETAKAARELEEVVRQTEVAAREWGVRPDHLEGRFVSALLGCLTWLGRIMQATASDMKASAKDTKAAVAAELETLRTANKTALRVLQQAEIAPASSDVQRQMAVERFVETTRRRSSRRSARRWSFASAGITGPCTGAALPGSRRWRAACCWAGTCGGAGVQTMWR